MTRAALDVRAISRLFKALSDDTRLRIVALLSHGELCVCHVQEALDLPQPNVSRHLGILRSGGIVEDRREGSWVYYRLLPQKDQDCELQMRALTRAFAQRDTLRRDVQRLLKIRGSRLCK